MADTGEEADGPGVVQAGSQHHQEIVNEVGPVIEVELERPVVELHVGHLGDDLLEEAFPPGLGGVGHHGEDGIVVLLVLVVEEDQLRPQVGLLYCTEDLYRRESRR